jgi:hypothetical protein
VESGCVWWLDTPELVQQANDQQEARYEGDPWEEVVSLDRGWRANRLQQFRRSWRNVSTSCRHSGPRQIRFVPPDAFGRKVGCGTGNAKVTGSNGGIGR